jgi:hypothetical protein
MATRVRLFVSAGPDQEPARELLGRVLAELPINIGWLIKRTPDVDSVAESHLFAVLLGADIWAPVGLELWWAQRTEKPIMAYRADGLRTPAAQAFLREHAMLDWQPFADLQQQLRRVFSRDIARFLVSHAERYGLTLIEAEMLREFLARLDQPPPVTVAETVRGAGGGGVILAPGKDEPIGARLIDTD